MPQAADLRDYPMGARLYATRDTSICSKGEPGVVVEAYELGGRGGRTVAFRGGGYDGFSPEDLASCCVPEGGIDEGAAAYAFRNVGQLARDIAAKRFGFEAFAPYGEWLAKREAAILAAASPQPEPSRKPAL